MSQMSNLDAVRIVVPHPLDIFTDPSLWPCHPQGELKQLKEQKELQQDHPGLRGEGLVMLSSCQRGSSYFSVEFYNVRTRFKPEPK